jgi:CBS domain-containing protein/anti-sigma regulatory factor (Ser/Thr protein kinase)
MAKNREITKVQELAYELKVGEAMTRDVVTVGPNTTIAQLREILRKRRISGAPVVDGGKLVGIISIEDFIKSLIDGELDISVKERMTTDVEILYSDEPLVHAVSKFDAFGFGRFPVIERGTEKLVGIITKGDIVKALLRELEINYHEEEIHRYRASHIFEDISSDNTTLIFEYDIKPRDFKSAGEASSRLKRSLRRLGMHPVTVRHAAIATFEAEMNIVIFTSGGKITAYVKPNEIRVVAEDKGPGIEDIELALKPGYSTAPDWVRELGFGAGMGLPNIKNSTHKLDIDSKVGEGTKLEFVINGGKNETCGNN